ncbi:hypothetical protein ACFW04_013370 [Cataglyphis niger]
MLRRMKKDKISHDEYVKKRKDFKIWCKEERKNKYINKYGKKRERIDEGIKLESWKNFFMDLLEGTERRVVLKLEEEEENEEEI